MANDTDDIETQLEDAAGIKSEFGLEVTDIAELTASIYTQRPLDYIDEIPNMSRYSLICDSTDVGSLDNQYGYFGAVYADKSLTPPRIIIVHKGTFAASDVEAKGCLIDDARIFAFNKKQPKQFKVGVLPLLEKAEQILQDRHDIKLQDCMVLNTGHSLGGGLSTLASSHLVLEGKATKIHTRNVDPVGVKSNVVGMVEKKLKASGHTKTDKKAAVDLLADQINSKPIFLNPNLINSARSTLEKEVVILKMPRKGLLSRMELDMLNAQDVLLNPNNEVSGKKQRAAAERIIQKGSQKKAKAFRRDRKKTIFRNTERTLRSHDPRNISRVVHGQRNIVGGIKGASVHVVESESLNAGRVSAAASVFLPSRKASTRIKKYEKMTQRVKAQREQQENQERNI